VCTCEEGADSHKFQLVMAGLLLAAVQSRCEEWCVEPCENLNGDVGMECIGCTKDYLCRRGEHGFRESEGASRLAGLPVEQGSVALESNGAQTVFGAQTVSTEPMDDTTRAVEFAPLPWRVDMCSDHIPMWMATELSTGGDRPDHLREPIAHAVRRCKEQIRPAVSQSEPDFQGSEARPVMRVAASTLSGHVFADEMLHPGLPIVIEGLRDVVHRWSAIQEVLILAADEGAAAKGREYGLANICQTDRCQKVHLAATEIPFLVQLGHLLHRYIRVSHQAIFSGNAGDTFGGGMHFDMTCNLVMSTQLVGNKSWTLWAPPWGGHPRRGEVWPHARFEANLHAGDAIVFPPGWTHGTHIIDGPSVAVSQNILDAPPYASMPAGFTDRSPFGYEYCARFPESGWDASNAQLDLAGRDTYD
jgi:hypothetical protein